MRDLLLVCFLRTEKNHLTEASFSSEFWSQDKLLNTVFGSFQFVNVASSTSSKLFSDKPTVHQPVRKKVCNCVRTKQHLRTGDRRIARNIVRIHSEFIFPYICCTCYSLIILAILTWRGPKKKSEPCSFKGVSWFDCGYNFISPDR